MRVNESVSYALRVNECELCMRVNEYVSYALRVNESVSYACV